MIEKIVLDYLKSHIEYPVYMEQPKTKPVTFVLLEKTSGGRENCLNSATIAIQSYSDTLFKAAELNETVKTTMLSIIELKEIARCSLNSDYNFTDDTTKQYRYQAVYNFTYYN